MEKAIMESGVEVFGSRQTREEEVVIQTECVAVAEPSPHARGESDTEVEKVLHLLVQKQQVRELESKPPDPNFPQSSNWSDMIEEEVDDQLQISKESTNHNGNYSLTLFRPPGPDQDLVLGVGKNKVTFIINPNKYPIFSMRANDLPISFLQSLGMSSDFYSNPSSDPNRVPNLWLIWKDSISAPTMIDYSNQHITVMVDRVLITIVHAHSLYVQRRHLWLELSTINSLNLPWLILGDFNAYLSVSEKRGGNNPTTTSMNDFRDFMKNNQLMEVSNSGFHLTWWNKQVREFKILGKLDRMLCNANWGSTFPGWKYKVVSRICFDHSPIMGGNISIPRPNNMPFKFFNMWCSHLKFRKVVMDSWQEPILGHSIYILTQKLKRLKGVLKKWNKDTFGNIRLKVEEETKKLE
ncbi:hypothetical protein IFM89_000079 [Coptis chinensis]|uniref:Endonuclease/exonuclease/phosphatase domain-containing protein n=1 Tax=Coptis chinensis TaxID=261450 RepID=A0A835LWN5_9MAGN|nr:hypothetical protein IFM89_000079 [Coptis chinensis]